MKAWNKILHIALTGVTNRQTLANFEWLALRTSKRSEPPLLIASTLMVPGYIDSHEISLIAGFIAKLDPTIPYTLLGFHPDYRMTDLGPTSHEQARECLDAARQAGCGSRLATSTCCGDCHAFTTCQNTDYGEARCG